MLPVGDTILSVPSMPHLIALKLRATKATTRATPDKDFYDVLGLIQGHGIDVSGAEFQEVLSRYAPEHIQRMLEESSQRGW